MVVSVNTNFHVKFFDAVTDWYLLNCVAMEDLPTEKIILKIVVETAGNFLSN